MGHHVIRASALEAEDVRRVVAQGLELGDGALDHGRRPAAEDVGVRARRRHATTTIRSKGGSKGPRTTTTPAKLCIHILMTATGTAFRSDVKI